MGGGAEGGSMQLREEWKGFKGGHWVDDINVRDFIQNN